MWLEKDNNLPINTSTDQSLIQSIAAYFNTAIIIIF